MTQAFTGYSSKSTCVGEITGNMTSTFRGKTFDLGVGTTTLYFDKIVGVSAQGQVVTIKHTFPGSAKDYRVDARSEELAVRIAYALSYLKDQCDPTAGLGF